LATGGKPAANPRRPIAIGHLEKYSFFWEWQRDLKGSSLLKAAKWQLIEVPWGFIRVHRILWSRG